jgi:hypothetical protein
MSLNKQIVSRTIGENDGISQVFIQNHIPYIYEPILEPKTFPVPLFSLKGATFDFYKQVIDGISVNINNQKQIFYNYTANTSSFSAITKTIYDIYKLDFPTYNTVFNNFDIEGDEILPDSATTIGATAETITTDTISEILENPLITLYDTGSTITLPNYTLDLPFIVKPENQFAQPLLEDKAQYFIDTRYEFPLERDKSLGGYQILSGGVATNIQLTGLTDNGDFLVETSRNAETISKGKFSGITAHGALFTYFVAPQKPNIDVISDQPSVIGTLDTFSPIFSFNNVSDGDYYRLQVTYDVSDTSFTGGTIFRIQKQEGEPDFIRTFSTPLTPDALFLYRIGNTKEITNIFGVKQNVTTWGRSEQALTASAGIFNISGTIYQDYALGDPSGFVGSPISGATVIYIVLTANADVELGVDAPYESLIAEEINQALGGGSGSLFSGLTDATGNYTINNVQGGNLAVIVTHPYYQSYTSTYMNTKTTGGVDYALNLFWGNTGTTFGNVGNQNFV